MTTTKYKFKENSSAVHDKYIERLQQINQVLCYMAKDRYIDWDIPKLSTTKYKLRK